MVQWGVCDSRRRSAPGDPVEVGPPAWRMYEKFYGLKEPPFNLTPDTRFLYLSQHHREAMAALLYGIRERKGFILLTGEIGSGKTTICRALVGELQDAGTHIALILNSYLTEIELLQAINEELEIDASSPTRKGLIDRLNRFLLDQYELGRNVVLIIDEAQNLADSVLEQIRMLGNLETEDRKLLQIVLIGQPELEAALRGPKLEQLNQRIAVRYHLRALDRDEIEPYVQHRLRVAGLSVPLEFTPKAVEMIAEFTGGVPRKINLLCDRALLAGYVASTYTIDESIVRTAAMEVGAEQWSGTATGGAATGSSAIASRWTPRAALFYALAFLAVLAMIPLLLSRTGLWERWFASPPDALAAKAGGLPATTFTAVLALPPATPTPTPVPPAHGVLRSTGEGQAATTAVFRLARPKLAEPWSYDEDGVVRVDRPEFCKTAAILTLLAAWGIEVNLDDFRKLAPQDAERLDIVEANRDKGLRAVEISGGLRRALICDVPVVVEAADPEKRLSKYVVLLEVGPKVCRVADPMAGVQEVPRRLFESFWRRAWVIYFDPDGIGDLVKGQRSETVKSLQRLLTELGFYRGPVTGVFGRATAGAIEYAQRYFEIPPTGRLDPLTVMLLTTHGEPDRPRLVADREEQTR